MLSSYVSQLCTSGSDLLARRRWGVPLALLVLVLVVYTNSFPAAFIQDDIHIVLNNPLVKSFDLLKIFTSDYWLGIENSGLYRPLTILSLALNRIVTGFSPWGFHLVNLLLHAGVTIFIWLTLPRWGARPLAALLAALLFAVHPIHTEVLNIVVGRSELLAAFFIMLALYVAGQESRRMKSIVWCSFALALFSKEHAIVLLVLLPLCDVHRDRSMAVWRQRWPLYLGMLAVLAVWLLVRLYGVEQTGPRALYSSTAVPLAYLPWDVRILTALQYQWVYLGKLLTPMELHAVYSLPDLPPILDSLRAPRALLVVGATLIVAGLSFFGWQRRAWWALPVVAYVISFVPTANIVMPIGVTMAERLAYFPSLWFCALLGWGGARAVALGGRYRSLAIGLVAGYVVILGVLTGIRNRDYVSEIILWQREIVVNDADYLGWQSYAERLNSSRRDEEAALAYQRVLGLEPDFQGGRRSYFAFLFDRGRFQEAIVLGKKTLLLAQQQGFLAGAAYDLINLARAHLELQNFSPALAYLDEPAAQLFERKNIYYALRGRALQGLGRHGEAIESFAKIESYELDLNIPYYNGVSFFSLGRLDEAQQQLLAAVRLNERPEAWNFLGNIFAQQGNYGEAVNAFSRAVELAPSQGHYQANLASARALLNR